MGFFLSFELPLVLEFKVCLQTSGNIMMLHNSSYQNGMVFLKHVLAGISSYFMSVDRNWLLLCYSLGLLLCRA